MTIQKFRNMDLIFLAVIAIVSDVLLSLFGLLGIGLFLSIAYPIIFISYVRWNHYGLINNVVLMVLHIIIYGVIERTDWSITFIHAMAILGFSSVIILIKWMNQEHRRLQRTSYLVMYLIGFLTVFFLEWGLFNIFGYELNLVSHSLNHVINLLFGLFIILIASLQKDLLINMKYYFIHKEKEV